MWRGGALNLCLVCLKTENLTEYKKDNEIFVKLKYVVDFEISDSFPTTFCSKCVNRLKIAYDFKKQFLISEKHLNSFFKKITQEFHKSLPENVFSDNEDDLEQYETVETKKEPANTQTLTVSESKSTNDEPHSTKKPDTPEVSPNSNMSSQISNLSNNIKRADVDYTMNSINEPTEMYQQESEEMYDILEIDENSGDDEDMVNLSLEKDTSSMAMEEKHLIYLNLKPDNDGEGFKLLPGNINDNSSAFPSRKRKSIKVEDDAKIYAKSAGDLHVCTRCNKTFSTRTNLYRHLHSHDGNKSYICPICKKGFTQSGSLKQHSYIHTGERPYQCTYCDKGFTQSKSLKFHLRRHTDEKPFDCEFCSAKFRQKDGLKRHIKSRHSEASNLDVVSDKDQKNIQEIKTSEIKTGTSDSENSEKMLKKISSSS